LPKVAQATKKKALLELVTGNHIEINYDLDGKIAFKSTHKEVILITFSLEEERETSKLFHVNIQLKKIKVDCIFLS